MKEQGPIPYTRETAQGFYHQLEQWNEADEFSRCIYALSAIPKAQRDYRASYALARALENCAVLGDHGKGTPKKRAVDMLHQALQVLDEVRQEGEQQAGWNMRMAYAYQY